MIILFFALAALENIAANLAHPITPTLIKSLALPDYTFGLMFAGMSATNFLFSPFWGKMADFIDSKRIVMLGCVGYGVGQFLFWHSSSLGTIMFARCFSGFFVGAIQVCMLTYLINRSTSENRASRLTLYATIQTVCGLFGYLIGGLLGELSIAYSFATQVVLLILCGILFQILLIKDSKVLSAWSGKELVKDANPFAAFIAGREFMTAAFAVLFVVVLFSVLGSTAYDQCFNYYIKDQFGLTSAYNGSIKAATGVISLIANMTLCMYIVHKTNLARSYTKIMAVGMIFMLGVVLSDQVPVFIVFTILYLAVNAISVPILQAIITDRSTSQNSNLVMGFYNAIKNLGGVLGALLAGFIYEIGPKVPFFFAAFSFGVAFLFSVLYQKAYNKK